MDIEYLQTLQESEEFRGSFVKPTTFNWNPYEKGSYVVRPLPPHPEKCPKGVIFQVVHWGKWDSQSDKKTPALCNIFYTKKLKKEYLASIKYKSITDPDRVTDFHIDSYLSEGGSFKFPDQPCWACKLSAHLKNLGKNSKNLAILSLGLRDVPTLYIPAYLPPVSTIRELDNPNWVSQEVDGPNLVCWNVTNYYLREKVLAVFRSNEYLTDPEKGKFLSFDITGERGPKRYSAIDFYPIRGGAPIHPDKNTMNKILDELYPNIVEVASKVSQYPPKEMETRLKKMKDYMDYIQ